MRTAFSKKSFFETLCAGFFSALLFAGCFDSGVSGSPRKSEKGDAVVNLRMGVAGLNTLAKGSVISLDKLVIQFTSSGNDTVRDTITSSTTPALNPVSTSPQIVAKNYTLPGLRVWKMVVTSRDVLDSIIHRDSVVGVELYLGDTAVVNLSLSARYSMYEARFLTLPDSIASNDAGTHKQVLNINRLVLKIDGVIVADSVATPGPFFTPLATHVLAYDYVSAGSAWVAKTSGTTKDLYSVQVLPADKGYAVGDSATARTDDDGDSWYEWSAASFIARSAFFVNSQTAYVAYDSGFMVASHDGGNSGFPLTTGTTETLRSVYFTTGALGYVAGDNGTIIKTTDSGNTWLSQSSGTSEHLNAIWFIDASTGYAAGDGGVLLKTVNGGSTWSPLTSGTTENLNALYFTGLSTGFAAGNAGVLLKTVNGGSTWSPLTSGTTENLHSLAFTDASTGWVVGAQGTILKTLNAGAAWAVEASGTTQTLRHVHFAGSRGYIVGNAGTILVISGLHQLEMTAYGPMHDWNEADPLFTGTVPLHTEAGSDETIPLDLSWTGPTTGAADMEAEIGKVGKVILDGTVPDDVFP